MIIVMLSFMLALPILGWAELGQGIYISQRTLENKSKFEGLVKNALEAKIDTFVVDIERPSQLYAKQIASAKKVGLKYVARIVLFPGGGLVDQVKSRTYWEHKFRLVEAAIGYGAEEIQLDYIRYSSKNPASPQNARDIYEVIKWFKSKLDKSQIPLQIDIFGIALLGESRHIGQNVKLFADVIDVMCPMTYPSHYEPFQVHSKAPYEAVRGLLEALKRQFDGTLPFRLHPFIEVHNYRYPMTNLQKQDYIRAQINAARDAGAQGWYAWSANNIYDNLFHELKKPQSGNSNGNLLNCRK